jgi:two-component system, cell cycle sensor histidine kinase and response regulator CckA
MEYELLCGFSGGHPVNHIEAAFPPMSALAISSATHPLQASKTILLVEDEAFVRQMIYEILEAADCRVVKCTNANEAKNVFRQYGDIIDVLVTDVVLPGENGRELAKDLLDLDPELKVILISGYPERLCLLKKSIT